MFLKKRISRTAEMKKPLQVGRTLELRQADDRRSPFYRASVFSLAVAKSKADRRNAMACEMFSPAFFRAHFAATFGRVAPIYFICTPSPRSNEHNINT